MPETMYRRLFYGGPGGRATLDNALLPRRGSTPPKLGRTHLIVSARSRMTLSLGSLGSRDGFLPHLESEGRLLSVCRLVPLADGSIIKTEVIVQEHHKNRSNRAGGSRSTGYQWMFYNN